MEIINNAQNLISQRDRLFKELDEVEDALSSLSPKVSVYSKYELRRKELIKLIEKTHDEHKTIKEDTKTTRDIIQKTTKGKVKKRGRKLR